MKINIATILLLLITTLGFSQEKIKGNGTLKSVKSELSDFKKLVINNDFKATLIKTEVPTIEIVTDENLHSEISFVVTDSILTLETSKKLRPKSLEITIFCSDNLTEIELNDDASLESLNSIKFDNLSLYINDYAKAILDINANNFSLNNANQSKINIRSKTKLTVTSTNTKLDLTEYSNTNLTLNTENFKASLKDHAVLNIDGKTTNTKIEVLESADVKGKEFTSSVSKIDLFENASAIVSVTDSITLNAAGKSKLELYNNPKITIKSFTNFAKIFKKEIISK